MTDLDQYYNMLDRHDWTYMYSDDPTSYRSGVDTEKKLRKIAQESTSHQNLFEAMRDYYHPHGVARLPRVLKPKRPANGTWPPGDPEC